MSFGIPKSQLRISATLAEISAWLAKFQILKNAAAHSCFPYIFTYSTDNATLFKESHPLAEEVNDTIEWIGNVSLKVELQHFRYEDNRIDYIRHEKEQLDNKEWKLQFAHGGTACCLAGADLIGHLRRANQGKFADLMDKYKC